MSGRFMHFKSSGLHQKFLNMPRSVKRVILVVADALALVFALWSAFALRISEWWPASYLADAWTLFLVTPVLGVLIFMKLGMYRAVLRYMNVKLLQSVAVGVFLLVLVLYSSAVIFDIWRVPRSVPIIFGLAAWLYLGGSRLILRSYYHWLSGKVSNRHVAIIYGAGSAGAQLALSLQAGGEVKPIAFIDDDRNLQKNIVCGLRVHSPSELEKLVERHGVDSIMLAMLNVTAAQRRLILERLSKLSVHILTMPTMGELISGKAVDDLREIEIEDLLGRDQVAPDQSLIARSIEGKSVCITGAGGSIGSELARQAVTYGAAKVVLYEQSEYALYAIEAELSLLICNVNPECQLIPILGSVLDEDRVTQVLQRYSVQTVYHAAAYKHVPLVEHNVLQGVQNNSLGTAVVASVAKKLNIERFILISTDKAVRPTNVMGATKRLAEIVVQRLAAENHTNTIFSMVRFGNVLGSSGSVVPLFKKQIEQGGPITVTHPEINRFFMTIPEAASLVIQAGSMAKGGDVFVLDMGEPVKIADLAKQMIRLSGRTVKDSSNPTGDIEVVFSGLRPGEKLYEELLIGNNAAGSEHPKILTADEEFASREELDRVLTGIRTSIETNDSQTARQLLIDIVKDFSPSSSNVDLLQNSQSKQTNNVIKLG
ncbi:UDP-N-acetyl-alpha-D-glucosamine C6 dehydratase [Marinobacterium sp. xm-a-121]|nr:UDP-N-acetyl-alpha-D-glucosamine C6 dehydratase [Marinobacterium sp. xm-a-121]NRP99909.1 UDP-N-acetyl-alpha-D-glucosamine C6 dehydratase [Marinobacterium sp. xm-v-233]